MNRNGAWSTAQLKAIPNNAAVETGTRECAGPLHKVMLVDDEWLAIHHLLSLVSWESLGFEIVAEATHPLQAVELFRKCRPDVVFLDIRMPGMDGLACSRAMLNLGIPAKIVLLTAYKEFEYAKEAVKLGVVDYLVKHELTKEQLTLVLQKLKTELKGDQERDHLLRRQLYADLMNGMPLTEEQLRLLGKLTAAHGSRCLSLLVREDAPLRLTQETGELPPPEPGDLAFVQPDEDFPCADAVPLGGRRWGVVLVAPREPSLGKLQQALIRFAHRLQRKYRERSGRTVSVAASVTPHELTRLPDMFKRYEKAIRLAPFFGRESLLDPEAVPADAGAPPVEWKECAARIRRNFAEQRPDAVDAEIAEAFGRVIASRNRDAAERLCRELAGLLDELRDRPDPAATDSHGHEPREVYTFHQAAEWFRERFAEAARARARRQEERYSRKVRQTLRIIHERYDEPLSVEDLAAEVGVSADHLRHLFKEETGETIWGCLTRVRMEQARRLLEHEPLKVYEVADRVGYRDSRHFSRVFRRTFGVNPQVFAERGGADDAR